MLHRNGAGRGARVPSTQPKHHFPVAAASLLFSSPFRAPCAGVLLASLRFNSLEACHALSTASSPSRRATRSNLSVLRPKPRSRNRLGSAACSHMTQTRTQTPSTVRRITSFASSASTNSSSRTRAPVVPCQCWLRSRTSLLTLRALASPIVWCLHPCPCLHARYYLPAMPLLLLLLAFCTGRVMDSLHVPPNHLCLAQRQALLQPGRFVSLGSQQP